MKTENKKNLILDNDYDNHFRKFLPWVWRSFSVYES